MSNRTPYSIQRLRQDLARIAQIFKTRNELSHEELFKAVSTSLDSFSKGDSFIEHNIDHLKDTLLKKFAKQDLMMLFNLGIKFYPSNALIKLLVLCGLDVNELQELSPRTTLRFITLSFWHFGCGSVNVTPDIIQTFLNCGAKVDLKTHSGKTPIDICLITNQRSKMRVILRHILKLVKGENGDLNEEICGLTDHFACKYVHQLNLLTTEKITQDFNLSDIFKQETEPVFILDEQLTAKLQRVFDEDLAKLEEKAPLCTPDLVDIFQQARNSRRFLLNSAVESFSSDVRREELRLLPSEMRHEIVKFLANDELLKFIYSGKPSL